MSGSVRRTQGGVPHFSTVGMLADVPEPVLLKLGKACAWQEFAADEYILGQRDAGSDVLIIQSGRVRTWVCSPEGKSVIYREIGAGEVFGDFAAIDGRPRSADVVALEPTCVARLPGPTYIDFLAREPALMLAQLRSLTRNIRGLSERIYQMATLNVQGRIQVYLMHLAQSTGAHTGSERVEITDLPRQSDIAAQAGTHREAVSRELRRLEKLGVLIRSGDRLVIDIARLQRELGEI